MLLDSITLVPSAQVKNFKIESAAAFPASPFEGQSLILTVQSGANAPGAYTYVAGTWQPQGDITAVIAGEGLVGGGAAGAITVEIDPTVVALKSDLVGLGGGGGGAVESIIVRSGVSNVGSATNLILEADQTVMATKTDLAPYIHTIQSTSNDNQTGNGAGAVLSMQGDVKNGHLWTMRSLRAGLGIRLTINGAIGDAVITSELDSSNTYTKTVSDATFEVKQTQGFGLSKSGATVSVATAATPYDIESSVFGLPAADAIVLLPFKFPRTVKFPNNFAGSVAQSIQAATASSAFTVSKNGVTVGTFTFAASSNVGVFASVGGTEIVFAAGDVLMIKAPQVKDVTLANISYTLCGNLQTV